MVTDPPPRTARLRRQYDDSERQLTLCLPPAGPLQDGARAIEQALLGGEPATVARAGSKVLTLLSEHYGVRVPVLRVLGVRPHQVWDGQLSYELFGDYSPDRERIRVWMRTAVLGKVTSFRGLLNTLLHEFCHHLDMNRLGYEDTPHTRGFYTRVDELYHLALATPPAARKPLVWRKRGSLWAIDWTAMRRGPPKPG